MLNWHKWFLNNSFSSTLSTFQDKWLRSESIEKVQFDYEKYKKGVWTVEDYTNSSYLGDLSQEHFFDLLTPKLTEILRKEIVEYLLINYSFYYHVLNQAGKESQNHIYLQFCRSKITIKYHSTAASEGDNYVKMEIPVENDNLEDYGLSILRRDYMKEPKSYCINIRWVTFVI